MRRVSADFEPDTYSVQSAWLSSSQRPLSDFFTMCATRDGTRESPFEVNVFVFSGGLNSAPRFGGGFCPRYGPAASSTGLAGIMVLKASLIGEARIVEPLPDSKMAA